MQNFSYHTHTVFSDGHNTIEEMLDRAEELGWREIGISDHLIVHKNITRSRSFPRWMNSPNNHVYRTGFVAAAEDFARHAENVRPGCPRAPAESKSRRRSRLVCL